jgi:ferredoxin
MKLIRSKDRKVTNSVTPNGKQANIANTFGLPSGKAYSCPGATSVCETICYAGKLEKVFKGVRANLLHNWELLKDADVQTMTELLDEMIIDFIADCEKREVEKLFRIHWDGDFFSVAYTFAWAEVILRHPDVQFWAYTRSDFAVPILQGISNLGLYFSTDEANKELGKELKAVHGVKLAYLAQTFAIGKDDFKQLQDKAAVPCPENNKKLPMISVNGSACVRCSQCVFARNDILFSATKK